MSMLPNKFVKRSKDSHFLVDSKVFSPFFSIETVRTRRDPVKTMEATLKDAGGKTDVKRTATPLNSLHLAIVNEMWREDSFQIPASFMLDTIFRKPIDAFYGSSVDNHFYRTSARQRQIFSEYYMPFAREVWKLKNTIGVIPYYFKKLVVRKDFHNAIRKKYRTKDLSDKKQGGKEAGIVAASQTGEETAAVISSHQTEDNGQQPTHSPEIKTHEFTYKPSSKNTSYDILASELDQEEEEDLEDEPEVYLVPVVPPMEAGTIYVYLDEDREVNYAYKWNSLARATVGYDSSNDEDGSMFFIEMHRPTLYGDLTSPVMALVNQYLLLETRKIHINIFVEQSLFPLHVIGYTPDIAKAGQSAAMQAQRGLHEEPLSGAFPNSGSGVTQDLTNLQYVNTMHQQNQQPSGYSRTVASDLDIDRYTQDSLTGGSGLSNRINTFFKLRKQMAQTAHDPRFNPKENAEWAASHGSDYFTALPPSVKQLFLRTSNVMRLKPYETYLKAPTPQAPDMNLLPFMERYEITAAKLLGLPESLYRHQSSRADQAIAVQTLNKTIRAHLDEMGIVLKEVFSEAILPDLVKRRKKAFNELLSNNPDTRDRRRERTALLIMECDVHIVCPAIPDNDTETLKDLMRHHIITPDQFFDYMLYATGFSDLAGKVKPTKEFYETTEMMFPTKLPEVDETGNAPSGGKSKGKEPAKTNKVKLNPLSGVNASEMNEGDLMDVDGAPKE